MGLIRVPGGWFEFDGEEPPGFFFTSPDEGGDPDTVRRLLGLVDDADAEGWNESWPHLLRTIARPLAPTTMPRPSLRRIAPIREPVSESESTHRPHTAAS